MRTKILRTPKGLRVRAIAGTYVVLLAFDCSKTYAKGLLGFSIERLDHTNNERIWLRGGKKFDLPGDDAGDDATTRRHPIQKFHWGDYTAKQGRTYTYTIHAQEGAPGALKRREQKSVTVTCERAEKVGTNGHQVHFNRSAAASQAYAGRFGTKDPEEAGPAALVWLSRGLEESLIAYIDAVKKGESLHLFVYEFEKQSFLSALKRAKTRGVKLRILYDALLNDGKGPSKKSIPAMKKSGLFSQAIAKGRNGAGLNLSHNKFMVLVGTDGVARSVWTGSTNFTDNAIYCQTNVGHAIADPVLAGRYLAWHQAVWEQPEMSAADSRAKVLVLTPLPASAAKGAALVLSPRTTIEAVTECAARVGAGGKLVCFTAPFALHDDLESALASARAQVFGLLNKDGVVGAALHQAPNTQLASAAALDKTSALEVWQKDGLAESLHHSGVFIHTKILLVDPLSESPLVVTGSANFSTNSSKNNDENQLFISGETEVADIYLGEFMRMFDHYYFRAYMKRKLKERQRNQEAGFLKRDDSWAVEFFGGGPKDAMRKAFF